MSDQKLSHTLLGKQTAEIRASLSQDEILQMLDQGNIEEAVYILGQSHSRLATILRFRLDKINEDEREAVISPGWAERYRNEMVAELREQLEVQQ